VSRHYYLGLGYGSTYSTGTLNRVPTQSITDKDLISDGKFNVSDDPYNYDSVRDEELAKLQDDDTLYVVYPNQTALHILDEWVEDFNVPKNQREELWNSEGIVETYIHFINAEEENWYWLADAQVDYYDDDDNPVPLEPAEDELEEDE
tara:strand:- start:30 stop:473 length:444 start_codon:yes stop_codon:yes gene_type:complete